VLKNENPADGGVLSNSAVGAALLLLSTLTRLLTWLLCLLSGLLLSALLAWLLALLLPRLLSALLAGLLALLPGLVALTALLRLASVVLIAVLIRHLKSPK
jgi:hypothetical protein